jgi:hypothetical protein
MIAILAATLFVVGICGYSAGLFTSEQAQRESCVLCRATRFSGVRYGFPYERVERSVLTAWYEDNMDPDHGRDGARGHVWQPSGCAVYAAPGVGNLDSACPSIPPMFLLKPETELAALKDAPDARTRKGLIEALSVSDRRVALERVKLVVEYVYVHRDKISWSSWWQRNSASFGLSAGSRPIARR